MLSYQDGEAAGLWFPEDGNVAAELGHLGLMKALNGVRQGTMSCFVRSP